MSRSCDATSSRALTALDCSEALLVVLASDDIADSSEAMVLAIDVPELLDDPLLPYSD